jgi:glycosidase
VTFLGLHDQQRFVNLKGASPETLIQAFSFLFTTRGIPMVYYGDEIGMPGGNDPDNRRDFPGGWAGDAQNAFEESGRTPTQQQVFAAVRKLAHLRSESDALRNGKQTNLYVDPGVFAFARTAAADRAVVIFNNSAREFTGRIPLAGSGLADGSTLDDRFGASPSITAHDGGIEIRLAPKSAAIYR